MERLIQTIRTSLTRLGVLTAHPLAFGIVGGYALLWYFISASDLGLARSGHAIDLVHDIAHPAGRAS